MELNVPNNSIRGKIITYLGRQGTGKTTAGLRHPRPLLLAFEPGFRDKKCIFEPLANVPDTLKFCKMISESKEGKDGKIITNGEKEIVFSTFVIDTVDSLYRMICDYVVETNQKENPKITEITDLGFGKGYSKANAILRKILNMLVSPVTTVVWLSHTRAEKRETSIEEYTYHTANIPQKAREVVLDLSDMVLHLDTINVKGEAKRIVYVHDDQYHEAKCHANEEGGVNIPKLVENTKDEFFIKKYFVF